MKKINWDKTGIGIALGIAMPIIVYALYYFLFVGAGLRKINVSLCVASNLIPFYFYQKKELYKGLKGVLISTLIWAGVVAFLSLFTNYLIIG